MGECEAGSVDYQLAGSAHRWALRRAAELRGDERLQPLEHRVLDAVIAATASWSKLADATSARQLGAVVYGVDPDALSGGARERVRRALAHLDALGIVRVRPRGRGRYAGIEVALPPDPNTSRVERVGDQGVSPGRSIRRGRDAQHVSAARQHLEGEKAPRPPSRPQVLALARDYPHGPAHLRADLERLGTDEPLIREALAHLPPAAAS